VAAATPSPGLFSTVGTAGGFYVSRPVIQISDITSLHTQVAIGLNQAFNNSTAFNFAGGTLETYVSGKAVNATNDLKRWVSDYRTPQTGGAGPGDLGYGETATLVSGFSHVYKVTGRSTFDMKNSPWYGLAGRWLLKDISGPSSSITDATQNSFCYAYIAGQCLPGSTLNDIYVNAPFIEPSTTCWGQANDFSAPCVTPTSGVFGQAMLKNVVDADPEGNKYIRLTGMFNPPYNSFGFQNLRLTPDGQWGFYQVWSAGGYRPELFAVRIPTIATDTVNRSTFVPVPVNVPGGDQAAIRFGYDQSFRCHGVSDSQGNFVAGYNDACLTDGSGAQPFVFASEPQRQTTCGSGCTVNIPGVSGRYLYYRIERYKSGVLTDQGPTQRYAVP
jgi:hypothetical protein